jgi:hypothetical protein
LYERNKKSPKKIFKKKKKVIFIRRGDFNGRLSSSVYNVAQQFYNSAQLWRLKFGHPPIFWKSAYILEIRLDFGKAPIF